MQILVTTLFFFCLENLSLKEDYGLATGLDPGRFEDLLGTDRNISAMTPFHNDLMVPSYDFPIVLSTQ